MILCNEKKRKGATVKKKNVFVRASTSFLIIPYLNIFCFLVSLVLLLLLEVYDPTSSPFGPAMIMAITCIALFLSLPFNIIASSLAGICFGIEALAKRESILKALEIILIWVIFLSVVILTPLYIWKVIIPNYLYLIET